MESGDVTASRKLNLSRLLEAATYLVKYLVSLPVHLYLAIYRFNNWAYLIYRTELHI